MRQLDNLIDWKLELTLQERLSRREAVASFVDDAGLTLALMCQRIFEGEREYGREVGTLDDAKCYGARQGVGRRVMKDVS